MKTSIWKQPINRLTAALGRRRSEHQDIETDLLAFKKTYGHILSQTPESIGHTLGKTILISIHGHTPSVKTEGCLAKAIQAQGLSPLPLLWKHQQTARDAYRIFGLNRSLIFDNYFDPAHQLSILTTIDRFFRCSPNLTQILGYTYRGAAIGEHALSWVVRQLHASKIDTHDPELIVKFRRAFFDGMNTVHAAEKLFDQIQPQLVIFVERGYTPFGELFDTSLKRNLNTIQWVGAHDNTALHFKRYEKDTRNHHPISLHPSTWRRVTELNVDASEEHDFVDDLKRRYETGSWYARQQLQTGKRVVSQEELYRTLRLDPQKKSAVIYSHVLWDGTFFYGKSLFEDYADWLVQTVRIACLNPHVNWLVKLHPVNTWRLSLDGYQGELAEHALLRQHIGPLPSHIKLIGPDTPINTASLFQATDYCITVRGTIGMEMPIFGIPVLTAGGGRYAGLGFTIDSTTQDEYRHRLAHIQDQQPLDQHQIHLATRHAYGIFKLRPLEFHSFKMNYPNDDRICPAYLQPQINIAAPDIDTFCNGDDMQSFARWACHSKEPDLLGGL